MVVELTGLSLQSISGNTQNIMGESGKLQACVVPTLSTVLMLPYQYWDTMAEIMGVEPSPSNNGTSGALFYGVASIKPKSATFTGNLSITINDAVTVTIPNEQLIFDEPLIAGNGRVMRNPDWKNIPIVKYMDLDRNMPRIGGMFFSSAALMVNHDKNEFTIAPVQESAAAQKLMGIDTANDCVAAVEGGETKVFDTPAPVAQSPDTAHSSGVTVGAIAGIVVGIIAAVAIAAGIAFVMWKRQRTAANLKSAPVQELEAGHEGVPITEKHGHSIVEMPAGQIYEGAVEMDGTDRPIEAPAYTPKERI